MPEEDNKGDKQVNTEGNKEVEGVLDKVVELLDMQQLPHGNALSVEETYKITSSREVKFILLAGQSASGKSTLVTMIYHMFIGGPFAGHWFSGSETLLGFEQRAYNLRTSSNSSVPTMPKTRRGILDAILHLRLFDPRNISYKDLLITDLSGEDYGSVIGNVDMAKSDFQIVKRADHLVLLIDGGLLSQKSHRNQAEQESLQLLHTFIDAELINNNTCVDVLISKYDLVLRSSKDDPSVSEFNKKLVIKFEDKFKGRFRNLRFLNIAALPEQTEELPVGYGLEGLISNWIIDKDDSKAENVRTNIQFDGGSEFNLFINRIK